MDFLKKLFALFSPKPTYRTGAFEDIADVRNISLSKFQTPVELPEEFETPLPPVEDQGQKGKCVGSAIHKIAELYLTPNGQPFINLSDDDLYEQCKLIDGIPNLEGTYPSVGAKVACNSGIASIEAYNSGNIELIRDSRKKHRLSGYAFVEADFGAITQAIFQNRAITASFGINSKWFKGKIVKVLKALGRHYVVLNGFNLKKKELRGQNSWGIGWIGYIAGLLNKQIKPGCFEVRWKDYKDNIFDIIAFTYIPPVILEEAKAKEYRFNIDLRYGDEGYEVRRLQERLKKEGYPVTIIDGTFGAELKNSLIRYQIENDLYAGGFFGPLTRAKMNEKAQSSIEKWALAIQAHEGYLTPAQYPPSGSRSYRNNSPANFKLPGGLTEYMIGMGANGIDPQGFVKFPTYETGLRALCTFLTDACTDKLSSYKSSMTLLQFFEKYAPSTDHNNPLVYAQQVAKKVGATIETRIKELL